MNQNFVFDGLHGKATAMKNNSISLIVYRVSLPIVYQQNSDIG